ncbi:lipopolysaccharide biosynthesis protein [Anaeromyxobacter oryzisoli]|uniref:lipopolysaccharide biosynthesis protein n=1 Tax=Anaeromyxobacter oryzisoli TaxID=2925408 RepID=UPI001F5A1EF3|nr:hypothetical protein [Anaeromyxobacter sp. SG63]
MIGTALANRTTIRRAASWMMCGQAALSACNWLQFVLVARLSSMTATGRFALAAAVATPLVLIAGMNLRAVQVSDVRGEYAFRDYFRFRALTVAAAVVAAPILVVLAFDARLLLPVLLLTAVRALEAVSDIIYGQWQVEERWNLIGVSMIARGALGSSGLAGVLLFTHDLNAALVGLLAGTAVVVVGFDVPLSTGALRSHHGRLDDQRSSASRRLIGLAATAFPLASAYVLAALVDGLPRYVLEHARGPEDVASFSAALQLVLVAGVLVNTVVQSAGRHLAQSFAREDWRRFSRVIIALGIGAAGAGLCLIITCAVAGNGLLGMLFGSAYARNAPLVVVVSIGGALSYLSAVAGAAVTATRRFRQVLYAYVLVFWIAVASAAVLVPTYGLLGAAWTFVVSAAASLLLPPLAVWWGARST